MGSNSHNSLPFDYFRRFEHHFKEKYVKDATEWVAQTTFIKFPCIMFNLTVPMTDISVVETWRLFYGPGPQKQGT